MHARIPLVLVSSLFTLGAAAPLHAAQEPIDRPDPVPFCGTATGELSDAVGLAAPYTPRSGLSSLRGPRRAFTAGPCTEDGSRLDILIVYTPQFLAAAGDLAAVQTKAADAIAELNTVFANSGVPTTATLAGLREATGYTESPFNSTNLSRLRTPGDGYLDEVHAWRDTDRADLVCLFVSAGDVLGIANYGVLAGFQPRPDLGFSVVQLAALDPGDAVFAHEIGHNLGLVHDNASEPCALTGADPAGHGYVDPGEAFSTVMASGALAPRELRFSDPFAMVGGLPAGEPGVADNALVASQAVVVASRFRDRDQDNDGTCDADQIAADPSLDCNANGILDPFDTDLNLNGSPDDCDIASGTSLDLDLDGVPDEAELARIYVDADAAPGGSGTDWADATNDLQFALALARASGDTSEIWIAEGTYTPGVHKGDYFDLVGGVAYLGGFNGTETLATERDLSAYTTRLSGDLFGDDNGGFDNRDDNSVTVLYAYGEDGLITLDGLTVSGGASLETRYCQSSHTKHGGGLFALFADFDIRDCNFTGNAALIGGGVYLPSNTSWNIVDSAMSNNAAMGEPVATYAGGAYLAGALAPGTMDRCRLNGNHSDGSAAGLYIIVGAPQVTNTEIVGNYAAGGGEAGMYGRLLDGAVFNQITVALNTNGTYAVSAGARFHTDSAAEIRNSLFWGNKVYNNSGERYEHADTQIVTHGNVFRLYLTMEYWNFTTGGTVNDGSDPLFVDPIGPDGVADTGDEDVRLGAGSLVIDSGDTWSARFLDYDLLGNPRVVNEVDRGAYEDQTLPCPADVNGDGILDNGDIGAFINAFLTGSLAADFNGDGILDNGDIGAFIAAFLAGC